MDLAALLVPIVFFVVSAYALYWIVRKAVAAGIRDAEGDRTVRTEPVG